MVENEIRQLQGVAGDPGGGPYVILRLFVVSSRIVDADFETNGCPAAQKASAGLATFAKGRTLEQLAKLDSGDLLLLIGGLPEGKGHYADLAIQALRAVEN